MALPIRAACLAIAPGFGVLSVGLAAVGMFGAISFGQPAAADQLAPRADGSGSPAIRVQTSAPCTCRAFGRDYGMGETVCLRIDGKPALAECAMFLNNTSWRSTGRPCPEG